MSGEEALLETELESEFIVFGLLSTKLFPALEVAEQDNSPSKNNKNKTKKTAGSASEGLEMLEEEEKSPSAPSPSDVSSLSLSLHPVTQPVYRMAS